MSKKVLVVDDDPVLVKLLEERLKKNGYDVLTSLDPVKGLKIALDQDPDLVILDVLMPQMNGYTFFLKLKNNPHSSKTPVVVLTARAQMKDAFMAIGVDSFIVKPFNMEDLLTKINQLIHSLENVDVGRLQKEIRQEKERDRAIKPANPPSDAKKVLIGATQPVVADFMKEQLKTIGFSVFSAEHGADILELVIEHNPNFILLEAEMDAESVYEIMDKIKQVKGLKSEILLYTYFKDRESAKQSIVHRLLSVQPSKELPAGTKPPFQYFGIFDRTTFLSRFKKFLNL